MNLNPNIILAGSNPDLMAAIDAGNTARARQDEFQHQNAFRSMMQAQGPGIMQGNQNALAELSRFDPMQALQVQSARQTLEINANTLQQARAQAAQAARTAQDQQQAQAEAQQAQRLLGQAAVALQRGDQAAFGMIAREFGLEGMDMSPQSMALMEAMAVGLNEGVAGGVAATVMPQHSDVPESIRALEWRAQQSGLRPGTPEYQAFMMNGGRVENGMVIESDGQGGFRMAQGSAAGAAASRPFTEGQSRDVVYASRAKGALEVLEQDAGALTSRRDMLLDMVPLGIGREAQRDSYQVAQNAGNEFLQAILRKDTGAAITRDEQELYGETYLPQPGDSPAVLAAKVEARRRAIAAIEAGMSPAQLLAQERALGAVAAARGAQPATGAQPAAAPPAGAQPARAAPAGAFRDAPLEALTTLDVSTLSPAELRAFNARMAELLAQ